MKCKVLPQRLPIVAALVLAVVTGAPAQNPNRMKFHGVINDFTPASTVTPTGPWKVHGLWSLVVKGRHDRPDCRADCKADFSAALTMERSDFGVVEGGGGDLNNPMNRMPHTHHITLVDGEVAIIPGGIQVTGPAVVTANGASPPPFGSVIPIVTIEITGGSGENSVPFSNLTLTFGSPASGHFGTAPLHGVVRSSR